MIDPSEIINNLVAMLRDIPDLVQEMGGDPEKIYAYHDQYPKNASLAQAIHSMPTPSIMAVWQGTAPAGFGGVDVWKHQITLFLRARDTFNGETPSTYYRLFRLITKGIPASAGQEMLYATVHPACNAMDLPQISRQTDAEALDYFEVPLSFTEMGDQ